MTVLPRDYKVRPLWSVLTSREEFGDLSLPILTVTSESGVAVRDLETGRAPSEDLSGYRVVRPGDLVVNRLWARFGAYGVASDSGLISPAYWVLEPDRECVDARYLHHLLRSEPYRVEIGRLSKNMPPNGFDLPWDQFKWIEMTAPSVEEQRRIANFLDEQVTRIAALIAARGEQLGLISERQASAVDDAVLSGNASTAPLGVLAFLQTGMALNSEELKPGGIVRPYLRVANVKADRLDLTEVKEVTVTAQEIRRHSLRPGDVLMTEGGDLDKLARGTVWHGEVPGAVHQNHVFAVRPRREVLDADYLAMLTQSSYARAYFEQTGSRSTNLASTSASTVKSFRIPVHSIEGQRRRASAAMQAIEQCQSATSSLQASVRLLEERKRALITAAVTGEFDVSTAGPRAAAAVTA